MSLADERSRYGRQPYQFIEVEVDRCSLTYGAAPCQASLGSTGDRKCLNSWATCQDSQNFDPEPFFLRFGEPVANAPRLSFVESGLASILPALRRLDHSPGIPDPGESLGLRVQLTAHLVDLEHHDHGVDKYASERGNGSGPAPQGGFLRRTRARWPHYIGRRLRWYRGFISASPSLEDFEVRHYIMERWEGPDHTGAVRITAKDPLKLADNERAQAPRPSGGSLAANLDELDSPTTLDVNTSDVTEYDIVSPSTINWVRIGGEILSYTGTTAISGGVRLTGVARNDVPAGYRTEREDHDTGDLVQLCYYQDARVTEVVQTLLEDYAGIDPAWIDLNAWNTEHDTWFPGLTIRRLITEPTGVRSLLDGIVQQTLTWAFWWDERAQLIRYRAIRPPDIDETIAPIADHGNLLAGTVRVKDEPDRLANEVQVLYGQIDPAGSDSDAENFGAGTVLVDADSQSANEAGQRRIKRVFATWHPKTNSAEVEQFATRTLASVASNLVRVEFELDRKDEEIKTAEFVDLTTLYLVDEMGIPRTTRVQIIRAMSGGETMSVTAREDFFSTRFGRWAPQSLLGTTYAGATQDQRDRYMFWADASGQMSDASEGYKWA